MLNNKKNNYIKTLNPSKQFAFQMNAIKMYQKYYRIIDGIYESYWFGKFINFFNRKGKKRMISNKIYKTFFHLKYVQLRTPCLFILDILEQIKPTFKLLNVYHRGSFIKYPRFVQKEKQYLIAIKWLYSEIWSTDERSFADVLYEKFYNLNNNKLYDLLKYRDKNIKRSIIAQENMRLIKKFRKIIKYKINL